MWSATTINAAESVILIQNQLRILELRVTAWLAKQIAENAAQNASTRS
jgi:hypothetical protein